MNLKLVLAAVLNELFEYAALDGDKPAKAFIYITPGNNGFNFKSIGGHKLNENVTPILKHTFGVV